MGKSDLFRRSIEIGTAFVDMSRERAEAVVKEWVDAGDLGRGKAKKAVDDLLDRSRQLAEEMRTMVRREVSDQLSALGVVTADELARVEAKIDALAAAGAAAGEQERRSTAAPRRRAAKAAPIAKATSTTAPSTDTAAVTATDTATDTAAPAEETSTTSGAPGPDPDRGSGP